MPINETGRFKEKVAFVTGAGDGICHIELTHIHYSP